MPGDDTHLSTMEIRSDSVQLLKKSKNAKDSFGFGKVLPSPGGVVSMSTVTIPACTVTVPDEKYSLERVNYRLWLWLLCQ